MRVWTTEPCAAGPRGRSCGRIEREKSAVAPHTRRLATLGQGDLGELIIKRTCELRLQPVPHQYPWRGAVLARCDYQWVVRSEDHRVAGVQSQGDAAVVPFAFAAHL